MAARPREDPTGDGPVDVDSAGVYEGLSAEDLGYGSLPSVDDEEAADSEATAPPRPARARSPATTV